MVNETLATKVNAATSVAQLIDILKANDSLLDICQGLGDDYDVYYDSENQSFFEDDTEAKADGKIPANDHVGADDVNTIKLTDLKEMVLKVLN